MPINTNRQRRLCLKRIDQIVTKELDESLSCLHSKTLAQIKVHGLHLELL